MCGISACFNGTEDASIHCLKSGRVVNKVLPTITENTAIFFSDAQRQNDDRNPFADSNKDEEE